ncbi:hypothetical protein JZM05_25415 [Escherichia coli]|uniref:hypothetical protein n=1 Tax=Escherichia coli TaxID=562 RepID=UPI0019CF62CE|nr:hypothetical protein [Escherichia coli]MBN6372767.1 hypothetical protein [Escherichia coli]
MDNLCISILISFTIFAFKNAAKVLAFSSQNNQIPALTIFDNGHLCHCSCMHFFPIAFLITFKNEGTYPAHASRLTVDDKKLYFNMTQGNLDYVAFPFTPLKGNQMMLMTDTFTSASYPQK